MSPFRIFLVVFIALLAIAIGLLIRRLLVQRLNNTVMDKWLIQTLAVVIALLLILFIGIGIARTTVRLMQRQGHIDINLRTLLERILNFLVITITIFWVLSIWNISIAVPVAVISILTVAMAFAIQDIIKNLVAGFYILMERPFHIGDEISTASYTGHVQDIEIRATKLRLVRDEQITIPNSMVFGGIVVNNTYYGERRATITV